MKNFFNSRFVFYNLIFDALTILYVVFFDVKPERIIAFYWLDTCVMIVFFMIFLKVIGSLSWYIEIIFGAFILLCLNFCGFLLLFELADLTGWAKQIELDEIGDILKPYFDVGPFIFISSIGNYYLFERVKNLYRNGGKPEFLFNYNCVYSLLLIPMVIFVSSLVFLLIGNRILSLIICFLVFRNRLDYWRHKSINNLEKELANASAGELI